MATLIVHNSHYVTSLWLSRLGSSEEGDQFLEALNSSSISGVKYLNFCDNRSWYSSE